MPPSAETRALRVQGRRIALFRMGRPGRRSPGISGTLAGQMTTIRTTFLRAPGLIIASLALLAVPQADVLAQYSKPVDSRSYNLGIMGGFAEVVRLGVKELALSEVMTPAEMDALIAEQAELNGRLSPGRFHIKNAPARLKRLKADPMADVLTGKPDLPAVLERLAERF